MSFYHDLLKANPSNAAARLFSFSFGIESNTRKKSLGIMINKKLTCAFAFGKRF